jgi:tripartite-type tricarboxylate transporter receptor subunit TctC
MTASKNRGFEMDDIRPVAIVAISPDVIAIHPSNPAKDLKEFIANAKTKSFTYGSAGVGTGPQIGAEYFFKEVAKVNYVHVPFQGGAPAITATLGNHVDSLVLTLPPATPHIRGGALRGIGVASDKRNSAIPDVPTYGEMGYPNVYSQSWVGFFAPAKTPDAVVQKLNTEINALMKEPDSLDKIAKAGFDPSSKMLLKRPTTSRARSQAGARWSTLSDSQTDSVSKACAMNAARKHSAICPNLKRPA